MIVFPFVISTFMLLTDNPYFFFLFLCRTVRSASVVAGGVLTAAAERLQSMSKSLDMPVGGGVDVVTSAKGNDNDGSNDSDDSGDGNLTAFSDSSLEHDGMLQCVTH